MVGFRLNRVRSLIFQIASGKRRLEALGALDKVKCCYSHREDADIWFDHEGSVFT